MDSLENKPQSGGKVDLLKDLRPKVSLDKASSPESEAGLEQSSLAGSRPQAGDKVSLEKDGQGPAGPPSFEKPSSSETPSPSEKPPANDAAARAADPARIYKAAVALLCLIICLLIYYIVAGRKPESPKAVSLAAQPWPSSSAQFDSSSPNQASEALSPSDSGAAQAQSGSSAAPDEASEAQELSEGDSSRLEAFRRPGGPAAGRYSISRELAPFPEPPTEADFRSFPEGPARDGAAGASADRKGAAAGEAGLAPGSVESEAMEAATAEEMALSDPEAGKLWQGLTALAESPPAAGGADSLMPNLPPNQRRELKLDPLSHEAKTLVPGLVGLWEAALKARRGSLSGRRAYSGDLPLTDWTIAELTRLSPDEESVAALPPPVVRKIARVLEEGALVPKDLAQAFEWYRRAASMGSSEAQHALAVAYDRGVIIPKNQAEAIRLYLEAAKAGFAMAQKDVCFAYHYGQGLERSRAKAVHWCSLAAEQNVVEAQLYLGDAYYFGQGVRRDLAMSAEWYARAAQNGSAQAWLDLGLAYQNGQGIKKHLKSAYFCYARAAEAGIPRAQYLLAEFLYRGEEVEQNYEEALKWFIMAAEGGDPDAKAWLRETGF
jgi:TPR repeat protein